MPCVLSTIAGAPFEASFANNFFSVCFTSAAADNVNPLNNATTYALSPRFKALGLATRVPKHGAEGPPTAYDWICVRRIVLDKNSTIVRPYNQNCSVDDAQETGANRRLIRSLGTNGRMLFVIEDSGEYFFDGEAIFDESRGELWLQVLRRGTAPGAYSLRLTTTGEFLCPSLVPNTYTLALNPPPAIDAGDVGISVRIRSTTPAGPHPAGSTYYLRSYYGGLLQQTTFDNSAAYLFTSDFAPPPVGARIGFVKIAPSDAEGGNDFTYIVYFYFVSGSPVYMGIDANAQLQHYSTALPSDKKFHFQVRLAGDAFPNVPDSVGLFTLYHAQSNKYLTSGAFVLDRSKPFVDHRFLLKVADPPSPFALPANDLVAIEHHHMFFEILPDCFDGYAPYPLTANNIAPWTPPSCSKSHEVEETPRSASGRLGSVLLDLPRRLLSRARCTPSRSNGPQLHDARKVGEGVSFVVDITDCPAADVEPARRPPPRWVLLLSASLFCALLLLPLIFILGTFSSR